MVRAFFLTLAAASLGSAHFVLNWPPTAGFDDANESNGPCGGATPVINGSTPEIQVDRFAVQILSTHPAGTWSFRASTNTQAPYNFTEIVPTVSTTGAGDFCLTYLDVPSDFAGKSGVFQVIDNSVDGTLYQCAPVKFVTGSNSTRGPTCTNNTGFTAQWTTSSSNSSSAPASASSSTSSGSAAMATAMGSVLGIGMLAAGLVL